MSIGRHGSVVGLDSLRSKAQRSDGEQLDGRACLEFAAVLPFERSSGVKPRRMLCMQDLVGPCGINAGPPLARRGEPPFISRGSFIRRSARARLLAPGSDKVANLFMGAPDANLTAWQ